MNQKKCKRIRKAIRAMGCPTALLVMRYTKAIHNLWEDDAIEYSLPLTFKYPADSFQRVWRDYKAGANTLFNRS